MAKIPATRKPLPRAELTGNSGSSVWAEVDSDGTMWLGAKGNLHVKPDEVQEFIDHLQRLVNRATQQQRGNG